MDDRQLLCDAVRETGMFVLGAQPTAKELERKPGNEPVSEIDLAADARLKDHLSGARPTYGWLSEETADDLGRLECEKVWIVDPIDGTRAYLRGGTDYAVSAALVIDGKPVLAAIFAPGRDEFYFAEADAGARLNDQNIQVSETASLEGARAIAVPGFLESKRIWQSPWPEMRVSRFNSVALRICLVASGQADFTITTRPKRDWDLAAADLVVREAGGHCIGPNGEAFRYNEKGTRKGPVLATNAKLDAEVHALYKPVNP